MGTPVGRSASKGAAADRVVAAAAAPLRRPSWKPERGFCHNEFGAAGVGTVDQETGGLPHPGLQLGHGLLLRLLGQIMAYGLQLPKMAYGLLPKM